MAHFGEVLPISLLHSKADSEEVKIYNETKSAAWIRRQHSATEMLVNLKPDQFNRAMVLNLMV